MAPAVSTVSNDHSFRQILQETFKLAVAAAIEHRNKSNAGGKHADKMVWEGLKDIPMSTPLKTKKHLHKKVANELVQDSQPPNKMGDNGFKGINQIQKHEKKVFIRSRL